MSFLKEYTLLGELGTGGFAKVYKVRHNELGYIRAIRVLNELVTDEKSPTYQKFLRECKVLLRLGNGNHPNIVHIYQPRFLENHALVEMDYVDGKNLSQYLHDNGNFLPAEEVLRMAKEVSSTLAYCHEDIYRFCIDPDKDDLENDPVDGSKWVIDETKRAQLIKKYRVIHNDIHSGNIMRRENGSFVLLDFGLAITGKDDVRHSSRHENGAEEFKAPEKWEDDSVLTEQSDIYSFGVVMYEYLAGRVPFVLDRRDSNKNRASFRLGEAHKSQTPPPVAEIRKAYYEAKHPGETYKKDYPEWLEETIMKCLEKDPAKRFRNGKELHESITKHLQEDAVTKESFQNLSNENATLREENRQAYTQVSDLTKKNADLAVLVNSVQYELEKTRKDFEGLGWHEMKEAKEEIAILQKKNKELATLVISMQYELDKARKDLVNSNAHSDERLAKELSVLQDGIKQKDVLISNLQSEILQMQKKAEKAGDPTELQKRIDNLKSEKAALETKVKQTQQEKKGLEDEVFDLKAHPIIKHKPLTVILSILFSITTIIFGILYSTSGGNEASQDYVSIKTENDDLKQSNEELTLQVSSLQSQLNKQTDNNDELDKAQVTINELNSQINDLNHEISNLEQEKKDLREQSISSTKRVKDLEDQLKKANQTISSLRKEREKLQTEIKALRENCL